MLPKKLIAAAFALSTVVSASLVHAQEWPSKPITMIVPFPPGGTGDTNARLVAQEMAKSLGQHIVIDNKPGANGNVGTAIATPGVKIEHVPYRGGAPVLQDVLNGQVPILITNADAVLPHVKSGKLRVLAVTSAARNPLFSETPTIAEQGFPGFAAVSWTGISAPARTPPAIVARLLDEAVRALNSAELKKRLRGVGSVVGGDTPENHTRFVAAEVARWTEVAWSAGITVE